jgi:glycyl-tRNA synthetase beta chain
MAELLLELFSEEIPARMQEDAMQHLQTALAKECIKQQLLPDSHRATQSFVTPRRLAVWLSDVPVSQPDVSTERKGPKADAPQAAIQGFLKSTGLALDQLENRDGVYFASIHQKGKPTAEILKTIIEGILTSFPWPKSMRWGSNELTWVRPLHSILCIFDGKIVPVQFGNVTAGNTTYGHRFLSPQAITITDPTAYETALEKAHVITDRDKRQASILQQAEKNAAAKNLTIKKDGGLLEEVTGLVEWPVMLMGSIDQQFMDLPPEVLTTVMRSHQKYFSLLDAKGNLAPHFLITSNTQTADNGKAIIAGNERVLRARFSDARFFWDQDRKKPLNDWAHGLETVTFHAKLGTVADKVKRIKALAVALADYVPAADKAQAARAADLCKADLVTGMVGEFAELQGIMGRYYALQQQETPAIADAIRDHYKPQGPGDSTPTQPVSICVALADKIDTVFRMFAIGEKPTGSKDPYALRRAALGSIRIILENGLRIPLNTLFTSLPTHDIALYQACDKLIQKTEAKLHEPAHRVGRYVTINESAYQDIDNAITPDLIPILLAFFIDRLKVQLKDQGIRHDVINAVVANGDDDLVRIVARAKALQDFLTTDDGKNLLIAYKRAANILTIEEGKDKTIYAAADIIPAALKEAEESNLAIMLLDAQVKNIKTWMVNEQFSEAMKHLSALRTPVDLFFDKIMVNCDDKDLRANRLRLLANIRDSMDNIANFALIEG